MLIIILIVVYILVTSNIFRKNKRYKFEPQFSTFGTAATLSQFYENIELLETAHRGKVRMVKLKRNSFTCSDHVIYEVIKE